MFNFVMHIFISLFLLYLIRDNLKPKFFIMRNNQIFLIFLISSLLVSCSVGSYMTQEMISENGVKTYEYDKDEVWDAVKAALVTKGYEIAYEDQEKGKINTKQKLVSQSAVIGDYSAQSVAYYRQYLVKIETISSHQTKVTLQPKVYQGSNDISDKKVWDIESEKGEIQLWEKMFNEIDELL